jgi:hypothetical protein
LEHPKVQLPKLGVLQQSIQWTNPREGDMEERDTTGVHSPFYYQGSAVPWKEV